MSPSQQQECMEPEAFGPPVNMLDRAMGYNLTMITRSSGDDHNFILRESLSQAQDIIWMLITSEDITGAQYWACFSRAVSIWSTRLSVQMQEMGFPDSASKRNAFLALFLQAKKEHGEPLLLLNHGNYFSAGLLRDFVNWMIEQTASQFSSIIVRDEQWPIPLSGQRKQKCISFRDLICSRGEVFFVIYNWLNIELDDSLLDRIQAATGGWLPAVYLLGSQLKNGGQLTEQVIGRAIDSVYEVLDRDFFHGLEKHVQYSLVLLLELLEIPLELVETFTPMSRENFLQLVRETPFFLPRVSGETYTMQMILQQFLATKQAIVSDRRRQSFLVSVGEWYENRRALLEPLTYYQKAGAYDRVARYLADANLLAIPPEICAACDALLDHIPLRYLDRHPMLRVYRILLCIRIDSVGKAKTAIHRLVSLIHSKADDCSREDLTALGEGHLLNALLNRSLGREFLFDMEQAARLLPQGSGIYTEKLCGFVGTLSALPLGGSLTMEEIVDQYRRAAPYREAALKSYGRGVEWLAESEACYYRGELESALTKASRAMQAASDAGQWDIASFASYIAMRAHLALGQWNEMDHCRKACLSYSRRDTSHSPGQISVADIMDAAMYYIMGTRTLAADRVETGTPQKQSNIGKGQTVLEVLLLCLNGNHKFYEVLDMLNAVIPRCTRSFQWIIKLYLMIYRALLYLALGQPAASVAQMEECYQMAHADRIVAPFAEYGVNMRKIIAVVRSKRNATSIPPSWLDEIDRQAALFESGISKIRAEYYQSGRPSIPQISLTKRERQAYLLLSSNHTIPEIAQEMGVSINTIRVTLSHIYKKLGVRNKQEAIQVASRGKQ